MVASRAMRRRFISVRMVNGRLALVNLDHILMVVMRDDGCRLVVALPIPNRSTCGPAHDHIDVQQSFTDLMRDIYEAEGRTA